MAYARTPLKWTARALGLATTAYASYVGVTWLRYGHPAPGSADDADPLVERFMPIYDVVERHRIRVAAPAEIVLAAACEQDLMTLPVVRAIFKAREIILGSEPDTTPRPRGLLALTTSMGWNVLGAVTQPWRANVVFRPLPADEFVAFNEPDYVKIVWTLRADAIGTEASIFRTETRAVATDEQARTKFRPYWAFLSAGISVIRWASLRPLKAAAERSWHRSKCTNNGQMTR
jgi:hypothetical protein